MDGDKKTKKGGPKGKQDKNAEVDEAPASSGDLVFGATSGNDMVNFGGEDEKFGEAKRENNIIRKYNLLHKISNPTNKAKPSV